MKRKRILIKGIVVQDIGYRLFLYESAEARDISEFQARNIEDGVEVLVGGEDVDTFVGFVRAERPEQAEIEAIEVDDYEGTIKPIERFAQSFMLAQIGKFVNIGMEMLATGKGIKRDTGMMLEKQEETISEIRGLRYDLKSYMEERFNRLEQEIQEIKAKIGMP